MTEQELRRLRRAELLEMMLDLNKENEVLRAQLAKAHKQLANRTVATENAGSLAEAALQISGVFEAAQEACEIYRMNLQQRTEEQEGICARMEKESREKCEAMEAEAQEKYNAMIAQAQAQCNSLLAETQARCDSMVADAQQQVVSSEMAVQKQEGICALMEKETRENCDRMIVEAQQRADAYKNEVEQAVQKMVDSYSWLSKVMK